MSPRRQRGEGSVHQRADGQWVGQLDLGWRVDRDTGKRKRVRKTVYGATQREAVQKLQKVRQQASAGRIVAKTVTVETWMTHWLDEIAPQTQKPGTLATNKSVIERHIIPAIGPVKLEKLTQAHVRELHRHVTVVEGLSSTTALNVHRVLQKALNDALREDIVSRNVAALTPKPRAQESDRGALTLADFAAMMRHLDGDRLQSRWAFSLFTGARQGECLGLTWEHVDLQRGTADLAWQLQRIPYRHGCGERRKDRTWPCGRRADHCPEKALNVQLGFTYRRLDGNLCLLRPKTTGSIRVVPMPDMLTLAMTERRELYEVERAAYDVDHGLVWPRPNGRPISAGDDLRQWTDMLAALDIEHKVLHAARHTASTLLLALGVPEDVRMAILGHSEAATHRGYAHVDLSLQRQAMATYDDAVRKALGA